jgi:hypothetical protein
MPVFKIGDTNTTTIPTIAVDQLEVGRHVFQLVVEDDGGNQSDKATIEVIVRDTQRPTAILEAVAPVEAGQSFNLDGRRSSDVPPGKVLKWIWTRLQDVTVTPLPGPVTPGPITPGPVIPGPVLPGPVTPGPLTPGTPRPVTPGPVINPVTPNP